MFGLSSNLNLRSSMLHCYGAIPIMLRTPASASWSIFLVQHGKLDLAQFASGAFLSGSLDHDLHAGAVILEDKAMDTAAHRS